MPRLSDAHDVDSCRDERVYVCGNNTSVGGTCIYCKGTVEGYLEKHDFTTGDECHTCKCGHKEYLVSYHGGKDTDAPFHTDTYSEGKTITPHEDLPTPWDTRLKFGGWYEKDENGDLKDKPFDFTNTIIHGNIKLYPK